MEQQAQEGSPTRFWLLAVLVVLVTGAAIYWMGGDGEDAKNAGEAIIAPSDEVLEVNPLVPTGKIATASWRGADGERTTNVSEPDGGSNSVLGDEDLDPFGDEAEKRKKAVEHLRDVVDEIHGLGVYVESEEGVTDEKDEE